MDNRGKDVRGNLRDKWAAQRSVCRGRELRGGWSQTVEDDLLAGEESELCLVGECLVALKIIFIVLNPKYISSTLSSSGYQIYIPSYLLDIFTWRFCKHFKQHSWKRPLTVHYFWPTLLLLPFFFFFLLLVAPPWVPGFGLMTQTKTWNLFLIILFFSCTMCILSASALSSTLKMYPESEHFLHIHAAT